MIIQAGIEGIKNGEELTAPEESGKAGKTAPEESEKAGKTASEESGKAGKSGLHKAENPELVQLPMTIEEAVQCAKNSEFLKDEKRALITERFIEKIEQREKF